jgi:hypothetical protein
MEFLLYSGAYQSIYGKRNNRVEKIAHGQETGANRLYQKSTIRRGNQKMSLLDQIIVSVVASIATAALAYLGFWRKAKIELRKEFENKFNDRKWEAYIKNIELIILYMKEDFIISTNPQSTAISEDKEYQRITTEIGKIENQVEWEIILVGSKGVIESYIRWKRLLIEGSYGDSDTFERMIDCINSMREDLGLEKSDINYQVFDIYAYRSKESLKMYESQKMESKI